MTFYVFDSGVVVNGSYVVTVLNRLSTGQMTTFTTPYAVSCFLLSIYFVFISEAKATQRLRSCVCLWARAFVLSFVRAFNRSIYRTIDRSSSYRQQYVNRTG